MNRLLALNALLIPALALAQDAGPKTPGEFVVSLIPHALGLLATLMTALVMPALRSWLMEKAKTNAIANAAMKVEHLAEAAVAHVHAGLKAELAAALADGKLTDDERKALAAHGLELLKEFLGKEGLSTVAGVLGLGAGLVDKYLAGALAKAGVGAEAAPSDPK